MVEVIVFRGEAEEVARLLAKNPPGLKVDLTPPEDILRWGINPNAQKATGDTETGMPECSGQKPEGMRDARPGAWLERPPETEGPQPV